MEYRPLGRTGLPVSALSLGSYVTFGKQVDRTRARELIARALDAGVNFFDGAESYEWGEAERIMGAVLQELGVDRSAYLVSSKVFFGGVADPAPTQRGLHRKHVVEACHDALRRLQVDHLDLYFCHRPDPDTPVEVTVRAMHDLVAQGKVMHWGTSEWPAARIREAFAVAAEHGLTPPAMEQPQYNLLNRDRFEVEYAHLFRRFGIGTTTWAPLRSGLLTGKYASGVPDDARLAMPGYAGFREHLQTAEGQRLLAVVRDLGAVAADLGTSLARLAIAWCLTNPRVSTVILGASSTAQLDDNLGALDVLSRLDDGVRRRIDAALAALPRRRLYRIPGGRRLGALAAALRGPQR